MPNVDNALPQSAHTPDPECAGVPNAGSSRTSARPDSSCLPPASRSRRHVRLARLLTRANLYPAVVLAIGLAAVLVFGLRYRFLLDDTFISLRYAKHLYEGQGIVYNPGGDRVEGYTNFLWMLLAAAHFPFTRFPEHFLLLYNRLFGVLIVAGVWWELRRRGAMGRRWLWLGVGLAAFHQTIHSWMSGGLETNAFTFLVLIAVGRFLREEFSPTEARRPWSLAAIIPALLMRPESYLIWGVLAATMLLRRTGLAVSAAHLSTPSTQSTPSTKSTRLPWKRPLLWIASTGLVIAVHVLWRRAYYGEWVPNTFIAKVPGAYFQHGIPYVQLYLNDHYLHWIVALICLAIPLTTFAPRWRSPHTGPAATLSVLLLGLLAYMAYVGGDHFEFRLLSPTVALFALQIPYAFEIAGAAWTRRLWERPRLPAWMPLLVLSLLGAAVLARQVHTALTHPYEPYFKKMGLETVHSFQYFSGIENGYSEGVWLRRFLRPGETIAFRSAGVTPYIADVKTIDMLGLNDRTIARVPVVKRGRLFHERWPPPMDYLEQQGVIFLETSRYVKDPAKLEPVVLEDNAMIVVRTFNGKWLCYYAPFQTDTIRPRLRERGAIVYPGPNEDREAVEKQNRANAPTFDALEKACQKEQSRRRRHEQRVLTLGLSDTPPPQK